MMNSLQKSNAFTLAETLITVTIIGIVAAITIPTLVAKYQKEVTINQFKKIYTVLNSALMQSINANGNPENWMGLAGNYGGGKNSSELFAHYFTPYLKIEKDCGFEHKICWADKLYGKDKKTFSTLNTTYPGYSIILEDGMIVRFFAETGSFYPFIAVDLNGKRKPNASGYDIFLFALNLRQNNKNSLFYNRIGPFSYSYSGNSVDRNNLLYGADGCNNNGASGGYACAGLIIHDNFKINYKW